MMYFFNDIRVEFLLHAERYIGIQFLQQHSRFSMPFFSANWAMLNVGSFFLFSFLNPLKILLPYPQTALILHKSEQICYMSAIKQSVSHQLSCEQGCTEYPLRIQQ